jgi:hypothetical protein
MKLTKMEPVEQKSIETANEQVPYIHLELNANGGWDLTSNISNPERILRIVGAKLVLRTEE